MKLNTTIQISAAELKTAAKGQDKLSAIVANIANAFGKEVPKPNAWKKLKYAMGSEISESDEVYNNGTLVTASFTASKRRGATIVITVNVDEKVIGYAYDMYADVLGYWAGVITSAVTGAVAASALTDARAKQFNKELAKL